MENNIDYKQFNRRFKSSNLDQLDYTSDNDSISIIDFDDEYSEVPNLYGKKHKKIIIKNNLKKEEEQNEEEVHNNDYENTDINIQNNNTIEKNIINQNLQQLMEINTNDKQAIINILMQDNLIQKKPMDSNDIIKEKNKNKFYYVESKNKKALTHHKENSYGRNGYLIDAQEGDPEFIKDINVAGYLLKDQIQETNENVAKLLFDEFTPTPSTKRIITRKEIGEKVKKALDKKRKNLEKIEAEMYEEQKADETFSPSINRRKKDGNRRNLDLFLRDQDNFQRRVEQKKQNLLLKSESEKKLLYVGHPNINKNSEEIAKKLNNDENVYTRLYKKKSKNKDKVKDRELIEQNDKKLMKQKLKKNAYSHIKSKINILHNGSSQTLFNKSKNNRTEPDEKIINYLKKRTKSSILYDIKKKLFDYKDIPTNKMIWNKFNINFDKYLKLLNLNNNEEINESQYQQLLYNLGMLSYKPETKNTKENIKENVNNNNNINEINKTDEDNQELLLENSLKAEENKIFMNSFNLLKMDRDKDTIKINDIKNFLIFILNI